MFGRWAGRADTKAKWPLRFAPPRGRPFPQWAREARAILSSPGGTGADRRGDVPKK